MKIALSQMDITWLDIRANTTKISNHIEQADASGAGAIVFPEMALTGFCMDPARAAIDPVSPEMRALTLATRGKRILVMAGAAVRQNGLSYNMFLFIQGGEIVARGGEALGVSHAVVGFLTVKARDRRAPREVD